MAIRYSADTEIRVWYDLIDKVWRGTVRDPKGRWSGTYKPIIRLGKTPSSGTIDRLAQRFVRNAEREERRKFAVDRKNGVVQVSPMFQAACPCDDLPPRRKTRRKRHA